MKAWFVPPIVIPIGLTLVLLTYAGVLCLL